MSSKKNLWKFNNKYQLHVTISTIDSTNLTEEIIDERIVNIKDKEKRKKAYGICGECKEPDLITKCWDAKEDNRPTAKEIYQKLNDWCNKKYEDSFQIVEYNNEIRFKRSSENFNNIQIHPQAIYTSRFLNFKDLPEPVNSDVIQSTLISECFDCQLDESDLNEDN
ncbi:kinase-like domain-containing protein [Rhizophagus irregularis DAOM 181602=DAOM 197198]|nr:kinase-like domain-containing protein [Rhizophagus irregularis DAOM 181602=DAOM 197198]